MRFQLLLSRAGERCTDRRTLRRQQLRLSCSFTGFNQLPLIDRCRRRSSMAQYRSAYSAARARTRLYRVTHQWRLSLPSSATRISPGGRTSYENVAVKALPPEVVSVSPARTGFPLARVLRHTASQPAGRFVDWRPSDKLALSIAAGKRPDTTDDQSLRCPLPQRLHTPTPNVPAGQRSRSPASTVAWTRTSSRIPHGRRRAQVRRTRLRRSQACDPKFRGLPNGTVSIPPLGILGGPPNRVSAGQRPSRARGGR